MSDQSNLGSVEVSLAQGKEWAKKYRNKREDVGEKKIEAYLIPLESIRMVLNQDIDAVRAYIGINNAGEQNVMLVGTKYDKETNVYVDVFKKGEAAELNGGDVVYDASRPAPPYDDPNSPMNQ